MTERGKKNEAAAMSLLPGDKLPIAKGGKI